MPVERIEAAFSKARAEGRKPLATYSMAGDPDGETALAILEELAKSADILEIGMPFTDPVADGPVIQAAGLRALAQGTGLKAVFSIVQQFRSKNSTTAIILMGYFNPVLAYGVEKFINDCSMIGVDGLIIADLPAEEADEIAPIAQQKNIALIRLVTPTTDAARLDVILRHAGGFLYYVAIAGVTGTASADPAKVAAHLSALRSRTDLPIMAGFGVKTPEDAASLAGAADGVIVGSALIALIEEAVRDGADPALRETLPARLGQKAAELAAALRGKEEAA
ncbi:MAG: tryptophan synthase subunit alpha [Micavibrio sp.]